MDPISITFVVVGVVIILVEACRYVKKVFFHHKEERHAEIIHITADELSMNAGDLLKFTKKTPDNEDDHENEVDNQNHDMRGKNINITITNHKSSTEHMSLTQEERGDSEVGKQLAKGLSHSISPTSLMLDAASTVVGVLKHQQHMNSSSPLARSVQNAESCTDSHSGTPRSSFDGAFNMPNTMNSTYCHNKFQAFNTPDSGATSVSSSPAALRQSIAVRLDSDIIASSADSDNELPMEIYASGDDLEYPSGFS